MSEATAMLTAIGKGNAEAATAILYLVYDELRRLATNKLAREAARKPYSPRLEGCWLCSCHKKIQLRLAFWFPNFA
jgi:hypothetical protein